MSEGKQELLPMDLPAVAEAEAELYRHEWTLERIRERRPEVVEAVLRAYAAGVSMRNICQGFRLSFNTLSRILESRPDAVEAHKEEVLGLLRRGQRVGAETLAEMVEQGQLKGTALPIAVGIITDQIAKLEGFKPVRTGGEEETVNDLQSVLAALPGGSSVTIAVGTGQPVKGGRSAGAKEVIVEAEEVRTSDSQSIVRKSEEIGNE